jgi:hypothetical protein
VQETRFLADFPITGSGQEMPSCGTWFTVGCLHGEDHHNTNLDGVNMEGKAVLKRRKTSCHRAVCPKCWEDWANREVHHGVQRLHSFTLKGRNLKPIHLTVSVPFSDYGLSLEGMRKKVYRSLKDVHCVGGMMIYHSRRKKGGSWFFSPHFHVIGYGWILDVRANYIRSGYVVKNIGIRKTLEGTIWYQLSHAGIDGNHHTITWFGALCYGKLHVEYMEEKDVCPLCGAEFHRVAWNNYEKANPFRNEETNVEGVLFFDDVENWAYLSFGKCRFYGDEDDCY